MIEQSSIVQLVLAQCYYLSSLERSLRVYMQQNDLNSAVQRPVCLCSYYVYRNEMHT